MGGEERLHQAVLAILSQMFLSRVKHLFLATQDFLGGLQECSFVAE